MTNTIVSISGVRGVLNQGLEPSDVIRLAENFADVIGSRDVLLARDTRSTGDVIARMVCAALLGRGKDVADYGVISTPALFRESRTRKSAGVMVTASHNEPEWNGLKFLIDGRGIVQSELERITSPAKRRGSPARVPTEGAGSLSQGPNPAYNSELVRLAGEGSGAGVRVVIDANGGAALRHAPEVLEGVGCSSRVLGGTPGVFHRAVDPTADPLELLSRTVKGETADVGFAFDCDGDRLVLVTPDGRKKAGDYTLTLALSEMLPRVENKRVVVSVDTTQAIDEVVAGLGGTVFRSKVGEANVVSKMAERGARLGGEGSSGGLIDGDFNYCRDSMLAAISIVSGIRLKGTKIFQRVRSYSQVRTKVEMERRKALAAIAKLAREYPEAENLDGLKIRLSGHSWVLVRTSGTEDVLRVSAESTSEKDAAKSAERFVSAVKKLGG